ncbi:MAG: hypothetical protein ACOYU5_01030, partial [Stygiobacter sp.]
NDTVIINSSDVGKLFVLINTGVIHGSSKKLFENNINPFWKYPANANKLTHSRSGVSEKP